MVDGIEIVVETVTFMFSKYVFLVAVSWIAAVVAFLLPTDVDR